MSRIILDLPDSKSSTLDSAISRQFAEIQRQLMGLVKAQQDSSQAMRSDFLSTVRKQQDDLTSALERLLETVENSRKDDDSSDMLANALKELRQTLADMPKHMQSMGSKMPPAMSDKHSSPPPKVTVTVPNALMERFDSLEAALVNGLKRSRSRTFGSNY